MSYLTHLFVFKFILFICFFFLIGGLASEAEERLFNDLFNGYNRLIRPVENNTERLSVEFGLTMSQLIDVVSFNS